MSTSTPGADRTPPRFVSREGLVLPGVRRTINVPNPAAGAGWSVAVPGGVQWRVLEAQYSFVSDAVVANRIPRIEYVQGGNVTWFRGSLTITASSNITIVGNISDAPSGADQQVFSFLYCPMPKWWLDPGDSVQGLVSAIDPGDQVSNIFLIIEELYATNADLSEAAESLFTYGQ